MGDSTVLVAHGVVALEQPNKTPRIHGSLIPLDIIELVWIELSAPIGEWLLTFAGDEGEKTLGEVEHGVILWHKHYIIIPPGAAARAPSSPPQPPHDDRCG
jgi:hypothetical protein